MMLSRRLAFLFLIGSAMLHAQNWVGTWAAAPVGGPAKVNSSVTLGELQMTLRETVHLSQGGNMMRLTLTNEFGKSPLTFSAAHVAFLSTGDRILPATDHVLTFGGQSAVTIPAGQFVSSDALKLNVPIFSDLVISLVVPEQPLSTVTLHPLASTTTYFANGDQAATETLTTPTKSSSWFMLKDVQVNGRGKSGAIVTLGDSITDGEGSTADTNRRWPDVLAARLTSISRTAALSVLNEGISGNRVLLDGAGPRALERLDRDVLSAPGVKFLILTEGINDIDRTLQPQWPTDPVTIEAILDGMKEVVRRARLQKIRVIGATLTPFAGGEFFSSEGEAMRQRVNAFIRAPGNFDGVIDFDKALQDPSNPERILPRYDHGDHFHPSDMGYAAMGAAIDLKLFR